MKSTLVKDVTLIDQLGSLARLEMHQLSFRPDVCEIYTHAMNGVPGRFVGTCSDCIERGEGWLNTLKEAGFTEVSAERGKFLRDNPLECVKICNAALAGRPT